MYKKTNPVGYAIALYELVKESQKFQQTHNEANQFKDIIEKFPNLLYFLNDASISNEEKFKFIDQIIPDYSADFKNLIKVAIERREALIIKKILIEYLKMSNIQLKIQYAKVITAFDLTKNEIQSIKQKLEKLYKKTIELEVEIDPSLISGYEIHIGSEIIQNNFKSQLEKMKNFIIQKKEV